MAYLTVNDVRLHFERFPQPGKPVLVLSHSLFFDWRMFEPLIELLHPHFDILAYDHRGQGLSSRAGQLDMDTLTDDVAALIDLLDLAPCYFAGNSMGGFVALRLAARYPERLAGCIVMGSSADQEHQLAEFEPLVRKLAEEGAADQVDTLMYIMFGDQTLRSPEHAALCAHWRDQMRKLGPEIGAAAMEVIHRRSVLNELKALRVPLLVLAGEQDHAYERSLSEQIIAQSGHGECRVIEAAGHSVALEQPERVADAILRFAAQAA
ncbi:MAG: alpha/beta fold hydrolase [Pseudomonadaceae bacterium]